MRHSTSSDRRRVCALLALCVLALSGCLLSPYEGLTRVETVAPTAADCGACHVAIYEEFMSSAHARSWVQPRFVEATSEYLFKECLGCHAPASLFEPGPLRVRDSHLEEGVTCVSCHFDDGIMMGPVSPSALVDPHPVARDSEFFLSADLCGTCHESTMDEWRAAPDPDKATCQACHMPPVTRTLTQGTGMLSDMLVAFEEEYEGRQHLFHIGTESVLRAGLEAELTGATRGPDGVDCELALLNTVPHLVPTGAFGGRRLELIIEGLGPDDDVLSRTETQLRRALGQSLRPNERRVFPALLDPATLAVRLVVFSVTAGGESTEVLSRRWVLP